ncbi:MAG: hypothetical protein P4L42_07915 [Desulfocapsaceae bacterium]|nr:hypothetical protein [Desulfocapsaceae bacterium]
MKTISRDQALACITHREFGDDILGSASNVVVVLTQDWCPQWVAMKGFLSTFTAAEIYVLEYNLTDCFDRFRQFKEAVFDNDQIPYLRYYRNGSLVAVSNAVSEDQFRRNCGAV